MHFTEEEKVTIIAEGEKTGVKIVCAKYDISDQTYRDRRYKALGISRAQAADLAIVLRRADDRARGGRRHPRSDRSCTGQTGSKGTTASADLGQHRAIKRAVAAGLGVAIVSDLTIQTEPTAGQLAILPLQGFQLTRPLHRLCWRKRARNPATLAFLALLDQRYPPEVGSERRLTHKG